MELPKTSGIGFKARLTVALLMLVLGFIGVIVTEIRKDGAWIYWRYLSIVYALLSLGLSWHLKKNGWKTTLLTVWHEIWHWVGLVASIFVVSYFVSYGLMGRFQASLISLLLLSLATYLGGVYIESTLIFVGIALACFAMGIGYLDTYLYNILVPLTVVAAIVVFWVLHRAHKKLMKK